MIGGGTDQLVQRYLKVESITDKQIESRECRLEASIGNLQPLTEQIEALFNFGFYHLASSPVQE